MPIPHRLRKHTDYQHAYSLSRKQHTKQIAYFAAPRPATRRSETSGPRVGLTVPKALGKAHDRNRIKRRLRAAVAANISRLTAPVDVILHPRRSVLTARFADLCREIAGIFRAVEAMASRVAVPPASRAADSSASGPLQPAPPYVWS